MENNKESPKSEKTTKTSNPSSSSSTAIMKKIASNPSSNKKATPFEKHIDKELLGLQGEAYDKKLKQLCGDDLNRIKIILNKHDLLYRLEKPLLLLLNLAIKNEDIVFDLLQNEFFIKAFKNDSDKPEITPMLNAFFATYLQRGKFCSTVALLCTDNINYGNHIEYYQLLLSTVVNKVYADENYETLITNIITDYFSSAKSIVEKETFVLVLIGFDQELSNRLLEREFSGHKIFKTAVVKINRLIESKSTNGIYKEVSYFCAYNLGLTVLLNDDEMLKKIPLAISFFSEFIKKEYLSLATYMLRHDVFIDLFSKASDIDIKMFMGVVNDNNMQNPVFIYQMLGFCWELKIRRYDEAYGNIISKILSKIINPQVSNTIIESIANLCFKDDSLTSEQKIAYMFHFYQSAISIEAIEGSGYKNIVDKLREHLRALGQDFVLAAKFEAILDKSLKDMSEGQEIITELKEKQIKPLFISEYTLHRNKLFAPLPIIDDDRWKQLYCHQYDLKTLLISMNLTYSELYHARIKIGQEVEEILDSVEKIDEEFITELYIKLVVFYKIYKDYSAGLMLARLIIHEKENRLLARGIKGFDLNYVNTILDELIKEDYKTEICQFCKTAIAKLRSKDSVEDSMESYKVGEVKLT